MKKVCVCVSPWRAHAHYSLAASLWCARACMPLARAASAAANESARINKSAGTCVNGQSMQLFNARNTRAHISTRRQKKTIRGREEGLFFTPRDAVM